MASKVKGQRRPWPNVGFWMIDDRYLFCWIKMSYMRSTVCLSSICLSDCSPSNVPSIEYKCCYVVAFVAVVVVVVVGGWPSGRWSWY